MAFLQDYEKNQRFLAIIKKGRSPKIKLKKERKDVSSFGGYNKPASTWKEVPNPWLYDYFFGRRVWIVWDH